MAAKKRTGLGRGISSLIPTSTESKERPVDVFFSGQAPSGQRQDADEAELTQDVREATSGRTPSEAAPDSGAEASKSRRTATKPARASGTATDVVGESAAAPTTEVVDDAIDDDAGGDVGGPSATEDAGDDTNAAGDADVADDTDAGEDGLMPIPGARLIYLAPSTIVPNAWQPRRDFDQEALDELTHSIREFGVLQPIVVRPIPDDHPLADEAEYELIMGERRLRATKAAELSEIPAILKETPNDDMLRDALLENLHRSELNPLEEASAYQQLLDDFGITQEQLAQRIGRSRPQISNTLRLLRLPIEVQRRVAAGVLSAGHARAILGAGEPTAMAQLADKIVNEDLSVRAAEAAASKSTSRATTPAAKATSGGLTGYLDEVGERLGDRLNTRVKATLRRTKGQIVIDFASVADLNRILVELGEDPSGGDRS